MKSKNEILLEIEVKQLIKRLKSALHVPNNYRGKYAIIKKKYDSMSTEMSELKSEVEYWKKLFRDEATKNRKMYESMKR